MMLPTEEQNYKTKSQLLADIRVALVVELQRL